MELDHSGFSTQTPTVFAGNVGDDKYILQVSPMGVRLLEGGETVYDISMSGLSIWHLISETEAISVISEVVISSLNHDF
jgi:hypothetical protein